MIKKKDDMLCRYQETRAPMRGNLVACLCLVFSITSSTVEAKVTMEHEDTLFGASYLKNDKGETKYYNFNGRTPSVEAWFSENPLALKEYQLYEKYSNRAFWLNLVAAGSGLTFLGAGVLLSGGAHGSSSSSGSTVMIIALIGFAIPVPFMLYSMNAAESHLYRAVNILNGLEAPPKEPNSIKTNERTEYLAFYFRF